ncbi:MAG: histidinol-phosphatase [bacterium]
MIKTNYHSHSSFCDGEGRLEEYVQYALSQHMQALGFSGHAPLPFPNAWTMDEEDLPLYLGETRRLKELHKDRIELYTGLEIDYLDEQRNPAQPIYDALGLDYRIGSVHMLRDPDNGEYYGVDGPVEELEHLINRVYFGSVEQMVTDYYRQIENMVRIGGFDFIGHLDLIKKHNRRLELFSEEESWYRDAVSSAVDAIADSGLMVEVNTGAIARGYTDQPYPSPWILKLCAERNIPITLNSDAHKPSWVAYGFEDALKNIREAGYTHGMALLGGEWQEVSYG